MEDRKKPTPVEDHEPTTNDELASEELSHKDLEKVVGGGFLNTIEHVGKAVGTEVGKEVGKYGKKALTS